MKTYRTTVTVKYQDGSVEHLRQVTRARDLDDARQRAKQSAHATAALGTDMSYDFVRVTVRSGTDMR